ncbi:MAG: phosphatase PAP2 family protein [Eubacterium sp.]|nr:phosphatase PAP2 family protein [Eubacterium sp.]
MDTGLTFYFDWEPVLMQWIQSILGSIGVKAAALFTILGDEMVVILIMGFLYWCYDKEIGKSLGQIAVVGLVVNPILKNIVMRRRPYFDNPGVKCLKPVHAEADIYDIYAQGYSFPSTHSTNAAIVYGGVPLFIKKKILWVIGISMALLIGLSRVALGVHYPTDVLFGWLTGILEIILMTALYKKVKRRWIANMIIFLIAAIGIFFCETEDFYNALGVMGGFYIAIEFEDRFVNFENVDKVWKCILRLLGGFMIYLVLNFILKKFFNIICVSYPMFDDISRFFRYFIVTFSMLGVYPLLFKKLKI